MLNSLKEIFFKTKKYETAGAVIFALAGFFVYLITALYIADTHLSYLDEGLYLNKGLLFVSGIYKPFQDYGLQTNHPPYAFLIPGIAQYFFGAGLETGRMFVIFIALLMLLGLWLLIRRLSNLWWAGLAIWVMAFSYAEVKIYTLAISQGLIACMLIWALFFLLGENRKTWQILFGVFISIFIVLTRADMILVFPAMILYIFWQNGKKMGALSLTVGVFSFILLAFPFGIGVLNLWSRHLPEYISDAFGLFSENLIGHGVYFVKPALFGFSSFINFWLVLRLYPVHYLGAISAWMLSPARKMWKSDSSFKIAISLSGLFITLWGVYIYAALGQVSCVDCLQLYAGFFNFLGLIIFIVSAPSFIKLPTRSRQILIASIIIIFFAMTGFSGYEDTAESILRFQIPRLHGEGTRGLWIAFWLLSGWEFESQRLWLPLIAGAIVGIGLLILALSIQKGKIFSNHGFGFIALNISLVFVMFLSPTILFSRGNDFFACGPGSIHQYAKTAVEIQAITGSSAQVYWEGRSNVVFLYMPHVKIFPAQYNHLHNFTLGGNTENRLKYGYWNLELAQQWLRTADYVLIETPWLQPWEQAVFDSDGFKQIAQTSPLGNCEGTGRIQIWSKP